MTSSDAAQIRSTLQNGLNRRPLDGMTDLDDPYSLYNNIPYDYANIEDYKYIQTPTAPLSPSSTTGLSPKGFGRRINSHLSHIANLPFRNKNAAKNELFSKNAQKRRLDFSRDGRYFCRRCRMFHRYDDEIGRSCASFAEELRQKEQENAMLRENLLRKRQEFRSTREFPYYNNSSCTLHNTKSESNLGRHDFAYSLDFGDDQSLYSLNPTRKISESCVARNMDSVNDDDYPLSASANSILKRKYFRNPRFTQYSLSSERDQENIASIDIHNQQAVDLGSMNDFQNEPTHSYPNLSRELSYRREMSEHEPYTPVSHTSFNNEDRITSISSSMDYDSYSLHRPERIPITANDNEEPKVFGYPSKRSLSRSNYSYDLGSLAEFNTNFNAASSFSQSMQISPRSSRTMLGNDYQNESVRDLQNYDSSMNPYFYLSSSSMNFNSMDDGNEHIRNGNENKHAIMKSRRCSRNKVSLPHSFSLSGIEFGDM